MGAIFLAAPVSPITQTLLFNPDNTYDIGASGATRPRDFFLARNATVGGTLVVNSTAAGTIGISGTTITFYGTGQNTSLSLNSFGDQLTSSRIFISNSGFQSSAAFTFRNGSFLAFGSAGGLQWSSTTDGAGSADLFVQRVNANILGQYNSTNPQEAQWYGTRVDSSNYERLVIRTAAGNNTIGTEKAGSGTARGLVLQTNGTAAITIDTSQVVTFAGQILAYASNASATVPAIGISAADRGFTGVNGGIQSIVNSASQQFFGISRVAFVRDTTLGWTSSTTDPSAAVDLVLARDAANILALKNGPNAQEARVYGTTTGSKYLSLKHDGTNAILSTTAGNLTCSQPVVLPSYIVSGLPAAVAGGLAYVTDATTTAITGLGLAVVGGGGNKVIVYSDGTSWLVL